MIIRIPIIDNQTPNDLNEVKKVIKKTWSYDDIITTNKEDFVEINVVNAKPKINEKES